MKLKNNHSLRPYSKSHLLSSKVLEISPTLNFNLFSNSKLTDIKPKQNQIIKIYKTQQLRSNSALQTNHQSVGESLVKKFKLGNNPKQKKSQYNVLISKKNNFFNLQLPIQKVQRKKKYPPSLTQRKSLRNTFTRKSQRKIRNFNEELSPNKPNLFIDQQNFQKQLLISGLKAPTKEMTDFLRKSNPQYQYNRKNVCYIKQY